jgi:hypothetical protein
VSGITATWQASGGSLSGLWTTSGHWKPASVPGAADTALIGVGIVINNAANGWTLAVGTISVGTVTVDMQEGAGIGTLLANGALIAGAGGLSLYSGVIEDTGIVSAGSIFQGGSNGGGTIDVTGGGTWAAGTFVQAGGVLQVSSGGTFDVAGAATLGFGAASFAGAVVSAGTLIDQDPLTIAGGTASIGSLLSVGMDADTLDPTIVPAPGSLTLSAGATVTAGVLDLLDGSTIAIDQQSALALGGAAPVGGAVAVAFGNTMIAASGTISAEVSLADGGVLTTSPELLGVADFGGKLMIAGSLRGAGAVHVGSPGAAETVELASANLFQGTISLDPGSTLVLDSGGLPQARLAMIGATLELKGVTYDGTVIPIYYSASGLLTVGTVVLNVGSGLHAYQFAASPGFGGDTVVTVNSAATWQLSGRAASGDWADLSHWNIGQIPGVGNTISIGPGISAATAWIVTATDVAAHNLLLDLGLGTLEISDKFSVVGSLEQRSGVLLADRVAISEGGNVLVGGSASSAFQPRTTMTDGAVWAAGGDMTLGASGTATMTLATGSQLMLGGNLILGAPGLGTGLIGLSGSSDIAATDLTVANGSTLSLDATSTVQLGGTCRPFPASRWREPPR